MTSKESTIEPLEQTAQKCAWCYEYLFYGEIANYNGDDPQYTGWMCHAECNLPKPKPKKKQKD